FSRDWSSDVCSSDLGKGIHENAKDACCYNENVISGMDKPFKPHSGIAILKGNLCEHGAVIKPSAASESLMRHTGKAVVFEDIERSEERRVGKDGINR